MLNYEQAYDLGQFVIACEGWTWTNSCPVVDDQETTGTVVSRGPRIRPFEHGYRPQNEGAIGEGLAVWRAGHGLTGFAGWVPDFRDQAAIGCLLNAVREAWDDCHIHVQVVYNLQGEMCWQCYDQWGNAFAERGQSEAGALAFALLLRFNKN